MKRTFLIAVAAAVALSCSAIKDLRKDDKPYDNPFYAKYLNTGSTLDANITRALETLRENPSSAETHNTLGALLVEKGFPKDAEREFERAVNADGDYYPAWYNLGLVRAARGDETGARRAFGETVDLKPGHAAALFQLGLVEEQREHRDRAVELYAKAYSINPALMDVRVNPRIVDSELTHLALLKMYHTDHTRRSMQFQGSNGALTTAGRAPQVQEAPSPQQPPQKIVTPAAPATDPAMQPAPAQPNQNPAPAVQRPSSAQRQRGKPGKPRQPTPDQIEQPAPQPPQPPATNT